jgi:hypothetical protein
MFFTSFFAHSNFGAKVYETCLDREKNLQSLKLIWVLYTELLVATSPKQNISTVWKTCDFLG